MVRGMIINGNIQAVAGAYGVANVKSRASVAAQRAYGGQAADEVSISSQSQNFSSVLRKLQKSDDVRMDRVNELRSAIASGKYHVSGDDIAASMLSMRY